MDYLKIGLYVLFFMFAFAAAATWMLDTDDKKAVNGAVPSISLELFLFALFFLVLYIVRALMT